MEPFPTMYGLCDMCQQCWQGMTTAVGAIGSATGIRAWLGARLGAWSWLSPRLLRRVTVGLFALALVGSSLALGGSGA